MIASGSSRVGASAFFATGASGDRARGRPLAEIGRTGHASDHPIRFPEGAYLKCLFAIAPERRAARSSRLICLLSETRRPGCRIEP